MFKILVIAAMLLGIQARTCVAQAASDTVSFIIDPTLPEGVLATTVCRGGKPLIVSKYRPTPSVLVHETVHVMQVRRYGGCPKGWEYMVANATVLLDMEAEASCIEAQWVFHMYGREVRKSLASDLRGLLELSQVRADQNGEEWRLNAGQIAAAFNKACPQDEPATGSSVNIGTTDSTGATHSPIDATEWRNLPKN